MYGIYILFLRNRPMHSFNRAYLLFAAILPLVLPFIRLPAKAAAPLQQATVGGIQLPEIVVGKTLQNTVADITMILAVTYSIICITLLSLRLWQWYKLRQVIDKNEHIQEDGYTLVVNSGYGPGSWGKYIFIPAEETNDTIIHHELAHIQLHHTRDVLLLDMLQIFFWPNIFLIWLRRELLQVHEFQADEIAGKEKHAYAQLLVSAMFNTCTLPSTHSFIIHPIKRRIKMLNKKNNPVPRALALLATGVALSLLLVNVIAIQSCNTKKWDAKEDKKTGFYGEVTPTGHYVQFKADEVKKTVHKMPQFDGNIAEFMGSKMVYPKSAMDRKIEGRVVVQFVIDKDGSVVNANVVKSPDTALSRAALDVVNQMPKWIRGETETGEAVAVQYHMPIMFKL
jgi:TonB family protein